MSWFEFYGDDYFDSLFMKNLNRDEAYLRIINNGKHKPVYLLQSHRECLECDFYKHWTIYADEVLQVNSNYKYKISTSEFDSKKETLCNIMEPMGEFGVYNLTFNDTNCFFQTEKEPVNIYLPIISVFLIYAILICSIATVQRLIGQFGKTESVEESSPKKARIKSLDTFRGAEYL